MWGRGLRDTKRVMGASIAVALLLGIATDVSQERFVPDGDEFGTAAVGLLVFVAVLLLVALFQFARTPFRQRDEARGALNTHLEEEHPALHVDVTVFDVTTFKKFHIQGKNYVTANYSLSLVTVELFSRMGGDCNIEMWLTGNIGEQGYKISAEHWLDLLNAHPDYETRWLSNPKEVPAGERKRGKVPFLIPYQDGLEGKHLDNQGLLLIEGRSKEVIELAIPGVHSWRADQEAISS
jgi:hypothetical protein